MMRARHIAFVALITLIGLLLPAEAASATLTAEVRPSERLEVSDNGANKEVCFTVSETPMLSLSTSTVTPPSIIPIARTLSRTSPGLERQFQYSKAVSAIDSTTAAARYGLYNHKILFVSHSRMYYLNRLVRLII